MIEYLTAASEDYIPRHIRERAQQHADKYGRETYIVRYRGQVIHADYGPNTIAELEHLAKITPNEAAK